MRHLIIAVCCTIISLSTTAQEFGGHEETAKFKEQSSYSPYANRNFPTEVYWGDSHLHTALSFDAGAFGNRLGPEEAYKFAKGEQVEATNSGPAKLSRPLDWLVVADHSDNMGLFTRIYEGHPDILRDKEGRRIYEAIQAGGQRAVAASVELITTFSQGEKLSDALSVEPGTKAYKSTWERIINAAEAAYEPGTFTSFIGYEWTSMDAGDNMHRVVILRDGAAMARQTSPYTTFEPMGSPDPRELWKWMENYEARTGGDVLALAHNGNLSNGVMFPMETQFNGVELDKSYVTERIKWEPMYEITQIKGDGETHPVLSPNDEFANYETWDQGNLDLSTLKTDEMLYGEYGREALKRGLLLEEKFGVNPYKFGLVGSTDSHTSLASAQEDNFFGKHSGSEPGPERWEHPMAKVGDNEYAGWSVASSGLAAVWATENTREAIFDAMERKEVYATTGCRMTVRFFGGYDFTPEDAYNRLPANVGYEKGVTMGGDIFADEDGRSPTFLVAARKDPLSGNLDRIQIVKGWTKEGESYEQVYDVVWSDMEGRQVGSDGKVPAVGNTVDVETATWINSIGEPELIGVWKDPDFDSSVRAFYYARVIEIPTPRWTAYEQQRFGIQMSEEVPMVTQERAYTSPIWYNPN